MLCGISLPAFCLTAIENRNITGNGNPPFHPHRANTTTGNILESHKYDDAKVCSACHNEIYEEWRSSIMSYSWDDPIYRALLRKASEATEGKVDHFCTGCHTPIGLLSGKINTEVNRQLPGEKDEIALPGVDCEACHNIRGVSGLENGAYVMNDLNGTEKIKFGPRVDSVSPYHQTEFSGLHTRSELCGTCHNVSHPFNDVPIERTYDEWFESAYRVKGVECQDCHMQKVAGKSAIMGPEREDRASHHFGSANTTILEYFGQKENAERARTLLKTSAQLDFVQQPQVVQPGGYVNVAIKVTNTGAGHKLPTGFPEGREVWVDFRVTDEQDKEIFRLGRIKDGKTEPGTKNFKVHLGNKEGKEVEVEVWEVDRILSDNRILPLGYNIVEYRFYVPQWVSGKLKLHADLNYWPFSQAFADALVGEGQINVLVENITAASSFVAVE